MVKTTFLATALFVASFSLVYAQDNSQPKLTQADLKALTDARIGIQVYVLVGAYPRLKSFVDGLLNPLIR